MEPVRPTALTEAQSGLWYAQALDPTNPIVNTGQYLDLRGPLDLAAFRAAVDKVGEEAEALALRFIDQADGPVQCIDPALRPRLAVTDLSGADDPQAAALAAIRHDMETPIDPMTGPMATQALYRLGPERHFWAQRVHHLANDGYGMVLLTNRIAEHYKANVEGRTVGGRPFSPLAGFWAEDEAYRSSAQRQEDAAWWQEAMAGMDNVVGMAPGRALSAHRFHRDVRQVAPETRTALLDKASKTALSWPDVLTGLVAAYCRRFVTSPEIVIGVPHMGRFASASARVPAMVMNVLPVRIAPDETAPIDAWLTTVSSALVEARRHGRYRSEQLRRDLGLLGGNKRLYGPLINVQPYDRPPRFHGLDVTLHVTGTGPVEDISFTFRGDLASGLTLEVDANPDLYSADEVAAHGERLACFLANAVTAARLADIATATPAEAYRELEAFNSNDYPLPETGLSTLIEQVMREQPSAPAVRYEGEALDYAALDRRSAALASQLRARGAGRDILVAIALPRSIDLIVALVAVLRAGAAYLPLDLDYPATRLAKILDSAKPVAVLATADPHNLYGERLLAPDHWPDESTGDLSAPAPDDAAYVIYTSGSTGDPKGVVVTHRAIVNRLLWMRAHYEFGPHDRILQKTPATFDVSVWEFFLPFIAGATLVVAPPGAHRDPAAIASLIRKNAITTLHFVPSMLAAFLDSPDSDGIRLARVFCSGEELPADLRDRFHSRVQAQLHNLYGPTEAAVDVSYWPAGPEDQSQPVPIGHAVWNTRLILLDEFQRPVPPGMVGHLHLGGVQLARGYLGRADLTAERFIDDPFHPGERLYLTGDLARRRPDGAVVFLGRADHQVKIRGLRIELGEIEAAIAASGLCSAATVIARDGRLIAYVVSESATVSQQLRAWLAERLPDYMVPAAFVQMPALPVTANGKLDRKALPAPIFESVSDELPATATERLLARLYAEVLELAGPLGARDDFFALGGDSLLAVRLMLRIREETGRDPGLAALFEHPAVAALAARMDAGASEDGAGLEPLITVAHGDPEAPALFVVHPAGGLCWGYRTLATSFDPRRMVYGLQAPALDLDSPAPESIDALASAYASRIVEAQPSGPYHLAGWSVGGIIAQAIAIELQERGEEVGLVAMLDSYPAECWRAEPEPTEIQALRALLSIAGYDPQDYPDHQSRDQIIALLREGDSALGNLPSRAFDGVIRVVLDTNRLVRAHHHRFYNGVLTHVRAANDHKERPTLTPQLWTPYAAEMDYISVPFLHPQLTGREASALIAPALCARMLAARDVVPA